jgi:hypothetical protein
MEKRKEGDYGRKNRDKKRASLFFEFVIRVINFNISDKT